MQLQAPEPRRPHAFSSCFKQTAACKQITMVLLMGKFGTTDEGLYLLPKGIKVRALLFRIKTNANSGFFPAMIATGNAVGAA